MILASVPSIIALKIPPQQGKRLCDNTAIMVNLFKRMRKLKTVSQSMI